jgi:hypothetical protein
MKIDFSQENARREAGQIYLAARARVESDLIPPQSALEDLVADTLTVEHIMRAIVETLTAEQRAAILEKVR